MDRIAAPPYDVISGVERERLEKAHPKNVVRLILPGEAGRAEDGSFYHGAAALLRRWREEGTLAQDSGPSFYPYRQSYRGPDGIQASRLGFLGAMDLEEETKGAGPLPHEKTLEAPRRDRTRLIAACRANLSPIFLLHPDDGGEVGSVLRRTAASEPLVRFTDAQGVRHELWRLEEPGQVGRIRKAMEADWTLIADGHHRYESALEVMRENPGAEGARFVLAFFCSLKDEGFRIFPIHRLVRASGAGEGSRLHPLLEERFPAERLASDSSPADLLSRLSGAGEGAFVAVAPPGPPLLIRLAREPERKSGGEDPGEADTARLQREIFTGLFGISPEAVAGGAVGYTPEAGEAVRQVESGEASAAFLLNPVRVEAVVRAARAGRRLPQKSTYFYPKVFTGLVIRAF